MNLIAYSEVGVYFLITEIHASCPRHNLPCLNKSDAEDVLFTTTLVINLNTLIIHEILKEIFLGIYIKRNKGILT